MESSFKRNLVTLSMVGATASQGVQGFCIGYILNKVQSNFAKRAVVAIAFLSEYVEEIPIILAGTVLLI